MSDSKQDPMDQLSPKHRALLEMLMKEKRADRPTHDAIQPCKERDRVPLSFAQRPLWFLQQYAPDSAAYNVVVAFRLEGDLNVAALETAISAMIARHEILRVRISAPEGEPVQSFAPISPVLLKIADLRGDSGNTWEKAVELARAEGQRSFNLASESPVRPFLWRVNDSQFLFMLVLHHIVTDGWSMGVLLQELSSSYKAAALSQQHTSTPLSIQYADYAQ